MLPLQAGVDTLRWRYRCNLTRSDLSVWSVGVREGNGPLRGHKDTLKLDLPGGARSWHTSYRGATYVELEASIPRVLVGHNVEPAMVSEVEGAVHYIEEALPSELQPPRGAVREIRRLDCVRDFQPVVDGHSHLRRLAGDPSYRRTGKSTYESSRNGVETFYVGPKEERARLYMKDLEIRSHRRDVPSAIASLADHRMRFEVEIQGRKLQKRGVDRLDRLREDAVLEASRQCFERGQLGAAVLDRNALWSRLKEIEELTDSKRRSLYGAMMLQAEGIDPCMSKNTGTDYRRMIRRYGLVVDLEAGDSSRFLDFDLGEMVLASPRGL